jgi:hypothetical protein
MFLVHCMACVNSGFMVEIPKSSCLSWTRAKHIDFAELEKSWCKLESWRISAIQDFHSYGFAEHSFESVQLLTFLYAGEL